MKIKAYNQEIEVPDGASDEEIGNLVDQHFANSEFITANGQQIPVPKGASDDEIGSIVDNYFGSTQQQPQAPQAPEMTAPAPAQTDAVGVPSTTEQPQAAPVQPEQAQYVPSVNTAFEGYNSDGTVDFSHPKWTGMDKPTLTNAVSMDLKFQRDPTNKQDYEDIKRAQMLSMTPEERQIEEMRLEEQTMTQVERMKAMSGQGEGMPGDYSQYRTQNAKDFEKASYEKGEQAVMNRANELEQMAPGFTRSQYIEQARKDVKADAIRFAGELGATVATGGAYAGAALPARMAAQGLINAGISGTGKMVHNYIRDEDLLEGVGTEALIGGTIGAVAEPATSLIGLLPQAKNALKTGFFTKEQAEGAVSNIAKMEGGDDLVKKLADIDAAEELADSLSKGKVIGGTQRVVRNAEGELVEVTPSYSADGKLTSYVDADGVPYKVDDAIKTLGDAPMRGLDMLDDEQAQILASMYRGADDLSTESALMNRMLKEANLEGKAFDAATALGKEYSDLYATPGVVSDLAEEANALFNTAALNDLNPKMLEALGFGKAAQFTDKLGKMAQETIAGGIPGRMMNKRMSDVVDSYAKETLPDLVAHRDVLMSKPKDSVAKRTADEFNSIIQGIEKEGRMFLEKEGTRKTLKTLSSQSKRYSGVTSMNQAQLKKLGLGKEQFSKTSKIPMSSEGFNKAYREHLAEVSKTNMEGSNAINQLLEVGKMNKSVPASSGKAIDREAIEDVGKAALGGGLLSTFLGGAPVAAAVGIGGGSAAARKGINKMAQKRLKTVLDKINDGEDFLEAMSELTPDMRKKLSSTIRVGLKEALTDEMEDEAEASGFLYGLLN